MVQQVPGNQPDGRAGCASNQAMSVTGGGKHQSPFISLQPGKKTRYRDGCCCIDTQQAAVGKRLSVNIAEKVSAGEDVHSFIITCSKQSRGKGGLSERLRGSFVRVFREGILLL